MKKSKCNDCKYNSGLCKVCIKDRLKEIKRKVREETIKQIKIKDDRWEGVKRDEDEWDKNEDEGDEEDKGDLVYGWEGESTPSTPPVVANEIEVPRHWDVDIASYMDIGNSVQYYEPTLVQWFGLAERWVENADQ